MFAAIWAWLKSLFTSSKSIEVAKPGAGDPPWLTWAKGELGQKEIRGGENPRILWYHTHATKTGTFKEDEIPWCASFICSALRETGFPDTNNALAASYINYGVPCDKDANGAITIFKWSDGSHHVSLRAVNPDFPGKTYLGGNQKDSVRYTDYNQKYVVASRWPATATAPSTSTQLKSLFPNQAWTDHALKTVRASKLANAKPSDGRDFFSKGMSPENWVHLLAAMAKYESGFDPRQTFTEKFTNSKGEKVVSTGLLQLSYESVAGYGFKVSTDDLKDPYLNITIALKILEKWVLDDGVIASKKSPWRGGARYWSVLRGAKLSEIKDTLLPFKG